MQLIIDGIVCVCVCVCMLNKLQSLFIHSYGWNKTQKQMEKIEEREKRNERFISFSLK